MTFTVGMAIEAAPRFAGGGAVFGPGGPTWTAPPAAAATIATGGAMPPVIIKNDARGAVEGEAERFARYFDRRGPKLVQEAVAAVGARRARGYE